jgi:colicin import membrane protein
MKTIKQISAAVSTATGKFIDSQRALCAALIAVSRDACEIGAEGIAAFREQMLAERELHDCKNIRNYYSTLAGRAKYLAQLDPANCKTLSGLLAQTGALIDLETKAHDLKMKAAKLAAIEAEAAAKAEAEAAEKAAAKAAEKAAKAADDEAAKAAAELAEAEAKRAAEHAANVAKEKAKVEKEAERVAAKVATIEAKAAPKQVTATAPKGSGEALKPASTAHNLPKLAAVDITDCAAELHTTAQQLAQAWTLYATKPSKTVAAKISAMVNRLEETSKLLVDATK